MKGERAGHPEQEHAPKPRTAPERLLDVGPGFPREGQIRLTQITRELEAYEDFAKTFEHGAFGDKLALIEILEQAGVLSDDVRKKFHEVAIIMSGANTALQEKLDAAPAAQRQAIKKGIDEKIREHQRAIVQIDRRLSDDHRPLARSLYAEMIRESDVLTLARAIRQHGLSSIWNARKDVSEDVHWIACAAAIRGVATPTRQENPENFSTEDKFRLLQTTEFSPSGQFAYTLPYRVAGEPLVMTMKISEGLNAFTLVNFKILYPGLTLNGSFSRATGELHVCNAVLLTLQEHFRIAGAQNAYHNLRQCIIDALFDAWERGVLTEEEYVTFEEAPALPPQPQEYTEPTVAPSVPETPIAPPPIQEKETRYSTRRFTWRRVMAALKRCGVEIDMAHAHPKLRYNGKTAGYLNSHDKDTRHNRQVVQDTLATLEIPFSTFLDKLR